MTRCHPISACRTASKVVLLSPGAAETEGQAGDRIDGSVSRRFENRERDTSELTVVDVAPPGAFGRDGVFADVRLVESFENFSMAAQYPSSAGAAHPRKMSAVTRVSRLYAKSIYDVANLKG